MIWQFPATIVFLSLIPSALISIIAFRKEPGENLNKALYVKLLIWGAISVLPGIILVSIGTGLVGRGILSDFILRPFLSTALIEESIKLTVIILILYRDENFRTINDGIRYSIAVAVGFAFAENIIYLTGSSNPVPMIISRSLTAVPLHAICGAFMGYFAGKGKIEEKRFYSKTLATTVIIHGFYNILINLHYPYYLLSIILLLVALFFLRGQVMKKSHQ
ncbi:MAG: PrsW family intramembrane metalloprotease [Spirochaetaceae bacterium]|nr:PrsW family intramembrane metalloprotease [Spirochaetaceae bacterium]